MNDTQYRWQNVQHQYLNKVLFVLYSVSNKNPVAFRKIGDATIDYMLFIAYQGKTYQTLSFLLKG